MKIDINQNMNTESIKVLIVGKPGAGKSSIINLLADQKLTKTESGVDTVTLFMETHLISHEGINIEATDIGKNENIHQFIKYVRRYNSKYHLVLFAYEKGKFTTEDTKYIDLINLTLELAPRLVAITHCEYDNPLDIWMKNNAGYMTEMYKSEHIHCITALSLHDIHNNTISEDAEYIDKIINARLKSRELLLNSILTLGKTAIPFHTNGFFSGEQVYFRHKRTGTILSEFKEILGFTFPINTKCLIDHPAPISIVIHNNTKILPITNGQYVKLINSNDQLIYQTISSFMACRDVGKVKELPLEYQWKISNPGNNPIIDGSEVVFQNGKWPDYYMSIDNEGWSCHSKNPDVWTIHLE